jgi:hypothetical protein
METYGSQPVGTLPHINVAFLDGAFLAARHLSRPEIAETEAADGGSNERFAACALYGLRAAAYRRARGEGRSLP